MILFLLRFYHEVFASVTDFTFYRTVFEQELNKTVLYLFLISMHVSVVLTVTFAWHYGPQFVRMTQWAQHNFPTLEVQEGILTVGTDQPLVKTYPGKQLITFVFDTTGTYSNPQEFQDPAFLLTEDKLYFRYLGQTQTYLWQDLSHLLFRRNAHGSFQLGPEELKDYERTIKWAYFPTAFLLLFAYTIVAKALLAVLFTAVGMSASARHDLQLMFHQYFSIAVYALTPAIIIDLGVAMTGLRISFFAYFIYLTTAAIYTYMATTRCVVVE